MSKTPTAAAGAPQPDDQPEPQPGPGPGPRPADPRHRLGILGESIAARHLTRGGMVLIDRNWRTAAGEIDLVLRDGDHVVFCEVKTRSSHDFGSPFEAVDESKLQRMRRCAAQWMVAHDLRAVEVRLDMVGVLVPRRGPIEVEHVAGIG